MPPRRVPQHKQQQHQKQQQQQQEAQGDDAEMQSTDEGEEEDEDEDGPPPPKAPKQPEAPKPRQNFPSFRELFNSKTGNSNTRFGDFPTNQAAEIITKIYGDEQVPMGEVLGFGFAMCALIMYDGEVPDPNKMIHQLANVVKHMNKATGKRYCAETITSMATAMLIAVTNKGQNTTKTQKPIKCIWNELIASTDPTGAQLVYEVKEISKQPSDLYNTVKEFFYNGLNIDLENEQIKKVVHLFSQSMQNISGTFKAAARPNTAAAKRLAGDEQLIALTHGPSCPDGKGLSPHITTSGAIWAIDKLCQAKSSGKSGMSAEAMAYCESALMGRFDSKAQPIVDYLIHNPDKNQERAAILPQLAKLLTVCPPATEAPAFAPLVFYANAIIAGRELPKTAEDGAQICMIDRLFSADPYIDYYFMWNNTVKVGYGADMFLALWLCAHGAQFDNLDNINKVHDAFYSIPGLYTLQAPIGYLTQMGKFTKKSDYYELYKKKLLPGKGFKIAANFGRGMLGSSVQIQPLMATTFMMKRYSASHIMIYQPQKGLSKMMSAIDCFDHIKMFFQNSQGQSKEIKGGNVPIEYHVPPIIFGINSSQALHSNKIPAAFEKVYKTLVPDPCPDEKLWAEAFWDNFRRLYSETEFFAHEDVYKPLKPDVVNLPGLTISGNEIAQDVELIKYRKRIDESSRRQYSFF